MARAAVLTLARRNRSLVRFRRPFEEGSIDGYVLDVGPRFFLIALVSDDIRFNGFQAFRIGDAREVRPHPFATFVEAALKKRRERIPRVPKVRVSTLPALLRSAAAAFPLVTIHRERVNAEVCQIGRLVSVGARTLSILEIGPGAVWSKAPKQYALQEITRVDVGGDYEDALHIVGGDPPATSG